MKIGDTAKILPTNSLLFDATDKEGTIDEILDDGSIMLEIKDLGRILVYPKEYEVVKSVL